MLSKWTISFYSTINVNQTLAETERKKTRKETKIENAQIVSSLQAHEDGMILKEERKEAAEEWIKAQKGGTKTRNMKQNIKEYKKNYYNISLD